MDIALNKQDDLNAILSVTITPEDYSEKVEKTLNEYRKTANIPGFRKGKVPMGLIKKQYGKAVTFDEINNILQKSVNDYLQNEKLDILGNPLPVAKENIDIDAAQPITFDFEVGLTPEFEVKLDGKSKMDYHKIVATEEMIDEQVKELGRRYGKLIQPEKFEDEDMFAGDFTAEGLEADEEKSHSGQFIVKAITNEDLKKKMLNAKVGDSFEIDLHNDFREGFNTAQLVGENKDTFGDKNGKYAFVLKNVNRIEPHEPNQELFDKIFGEGEVTDEKEFRARIKADIENMYKKDSDQFFVNNVVEKLLEKTKIELPESFLKKWMQQSSEKPVTAEEIEADFDNIRKSFKWQLIENKIIRENDINVSHEELVEQTKGLLHNQMMQYGQALPDEELNKMAHNVLGDKKQAEQISNRIYDDKLKALYLSAFKINEIEVTVEEFSNLVNQQK